MTRKEKKFARDDEKAKTVISTAVHALLATNTPAINVYSALRHALVLIIAAQEPAIARELVDMMRDQLADDVVAVVELYGNEDDLDGPVH